MTASHSNHLPDEDTCVYHVELTSSLGTIMSDLKWLVRIGKWVAGSVGCGILLVIPLAVTFFIHISNINAEVSNLKLQILHLVDKDTQLCNDLSKHIALPSHTASGQTLAEINQRLRALEISLDKLQSRIDEK